MLTVFFAPKTQPVWHHFASTQRPGSIASGTRSQVWPAAAERRRPDPARLRHLAPLRPADAQRPLDPQVPGVEAVAAEGGGPHPALGAVVGMAVAALERLARRPQRRGQVEVRPAPDRVRGNHLGARTARRLDQPVDVGEVVHVHRLAEVGVLVAAAALEHQDPRGVDAGRAVQLGEPPGGDRTAEARPDDADVYALGHQGR